MNSKAALIATLALATLAVSSVGALAQTARDKAVSRNAQPLGSDAIAERFVGKSVTFRPGSKEFLVHYGEDNVVSGKLVSGKWSDTGYYAITNDDSICLSWKTSGKGRLRCWSVLVVDGVVKKFNPDGSLAGDVSNFREGKIF